MMLVVVCSPTVSICSVTMMIHAFAQRFEVFIEFYFTISSASAFASWSFVRIIGRSIVDIRAHAAGIIVRAENAV